MRLKLPFRRLRGDAAGVAATEFALVMPGLVLMIVGIAQLGVLFMANAGLTNAVAEGARYATIYPRPSDTQILSRITSRDLGVQAGSMGTPSLTHGVDSGANYIDITVNYTVPLDFIFFTGPTITLTESRRAYVHPV